jgi:tRNA1(Val) A37 N6-methylase TrmN6
MILADFSMPRKHETAVEIGTGCGAIPLYWLSLTEVKKVFAIDIQESACMQLRKSIKLSEIGEKIEVIHADIKEGVPQILAHSINLVVCNPPYKALGSGLVNEKKERLIARHEQECTIEDVTKSAARFLNFWGRLCMCHRVERLCEVLESMRKSGIEPKKIRFVQQRKSSPAKLFLIEGKKGAKPGLIAMPTLFIEDETGNLSKEMERIYKNYGEKI